METVPRGARREVAALLDVGHLFRASCADALSPVSVCEKELASYMGFKYCIAVNSYASALFLALKAVGVTAGTRVLGTALSFTKAPSAVRHAEAEFVPVEATRDLVIDIRDLAWKADKTGASYLLLSHMRGRPADLDEVAKVCAERGIAVVEDCANSIGVWWDGRHTGHHGLVCCVSAESGVLSGAGDGGFLATDDVGIAARVAAMAGGYDQNFKRKFAAPESAVFREIQEGRYPNYSLQMSNVVAAVLRPQILPLEQRVAEANRKHEQLSSRFLRHIRSSLSASISLHMPPIHPKSRPCLSSFQFLADLGPEASSCFLADVHARGVPVTCFAAPGEAPGFVRRDFASLSLEDGRADLEPSRGTGADLFQRQAYDVCIPLQLPDRDCERAADVLIAALTKAAAVPRKAPRDTPARAPLPMPAEAVGFDFRQVARGSQPLPASLPQTPLGNSFVSFRRHALGVSPSGSIAGSVAGSVAGSAVPSWCPEGPAAVPAPGACSTTPPNSNGVYVALSAVPSLQSGSRGLAPFALRAHVRPGSQPASVKSLPVTRPSAEAYRAYKASLLSSPYSPGVTLHCTQAGLSAPSSPAGSLQPFRQKSTGPLYSLHQEQMRALRTGMEDYPKVIEQHDARLSSNVSTSSRLSKLGNDRIVGASQLRGHVPDPGGDDSLGCTTSTVMPTGSLGGSRLTAIPNGSLDGSRPSVAGTPAQSSASTLSHHNIPSIRSSSWHGHATATALNTGATANGQAESTSHQRPLDLTPGPSHLKLKMVEGRAPNIATSSTVSPDSQPAALPQQQSRDGSPQAVGLGALLAPDGRVEPSGQLGLPGVEQLALQPSRSLALEMRPARPPAQPASSPGHDILAASRAPSADRGSAWNPLASDTAARAAFAKRFAAARMARTKSQLVNEEDAEARSCRSHSSETTDSSATAYEKSPPAVPSAGVASWWSWADASSGAAPSASVFPDITKLFQSTGEVPAASNVKGAGRRRPTAQSTASSRPKGANSSMASMSITIADDQPFTGPATPTRRSSLKSSRRQGGGFTRAVSRFAEPESSTQPQTRPYFLATGKDAERERKRRREILR